MEKEALGKIVNTRELRVIQRTEQFVAEWGIGRICKCWVLRMGTTRASYQQRQLPAACFMAADSRNSISRAEFLKEWPASCLLSSASRFHAFGLEVCFDQKQLRRDQPLEEHSRTHARRGEDSFYGRRRIMQLWARLFDGGTQLGRDRAQIYGRF